MHNSDTNPEKHPSDPYEDLTKPEGELNIPPPIPAATVVLLRDGNKGIETLMLRKNKNIRFGGMWVFPGGRIDAGDYPENGNKNEAARYAAARETEEEAGIKTNPKDFIWFSHWTPPPLTPKRFTTWFFAAKVPEHKNIIIDGGEIHEHQWITPQEAIERHATRSMDFVPPTWVTLHYLANYRTTSEFLDVLASRPPKIYDTHIGKTKAGERVAIWHGDAGYENSDANREGKRHRLIITNNGFIFENTIEKY